MHYLHSNDIKRQHGSRVAAVKSLFLTVHSLIFWQRRGILSHECGKELLLSKYFATRRKHRDNHCCKTSGSWCINNEPEWTCDPSIAGQKTVKIMHKCLQWLLLTWIMYLFSASWRLQRLTRFVFAAWGDFCSAYISDNLYTDLELCCSSETSQV